MGIVARIEEASIEVSIKILKLSDHILIVTVFISVR
jgi:hypothetical protein